MTGIIILNWNSFDLTKVCVESILTTQIHLEYFIILADNNSTDNSFKRLKTFFENFNRITFIQTGGNWGYAKGNNYGIKEALKKGCQYICVANNDLIFRENTIDGLIDILERHPDIGIVGGKVLYCNNPSLIWAAGGKFNVLNASGTGLGFRTIDKQQFELEQEVEYVPGALFLMRSQQLKEISLLPECYFMGGEELDLCLTVKRTGYKAYYTPNSVCLHNVGYSTDMSAKYIYNRFRNRLLIIKRHYPLWLRMLCYSYSAVKNIALPFILQWFSKRFKMHYFCGIWALIDHIKYSSVTVEHLNNFKKRLKTKELLIV